MGSPPHASSGEIDLSAMGGSMYPTIRHGDRVLIDRRCRPRVGDLVVYIRRDALVAHRLVAMDSQRLYTRGDNQGSATEEVPHSALLGPVTRILRRDGAAVDRRSRGQAAVDRAWLRAPVVMWVASRLMNLPWRLRHLSRSS